MCAMHIVKRPCCKSHYSGRGALRIYRGPIYQTGGGFFGDIFRTLLPIITSRVAPYVGKRLVQTGENIVENLKAGTSLGTAIKRGAKSTIHKEKEKIIQKLRGGGKKKKKKKRKQKKDYFSV